MQLWIGRHNFYTMQDLGSKCKTFISYLARRTLSYRLDQNTFKQSAKNYVGYDIMHET